ncbi:class I SAM-dependent methyltransferase [uncultured Microbulbifer sp.]|uniref:class I SAM-dependent methyltransferase n=1 Tax=uncultured Microbulbifer sp. TaxID=348147 RepID=UPI00262E33C6|nr:class I SAM-dependent methyltransferase [uncultured Microbulbifer sp.]
MRDCEFSDRKILQSWHKNAREWVRVIEEAAIPSRRRVTDQAIIDAVRACKPKSVLDVGCGEGWLARALAAEGIEVCGIDGVARLIEVAQHRAGKHQEFRLLCYDNLCASTLQRDFDLAVCNFSLFGESIKGFFTEARELLYPGGHLVVQTLHPPLCCGEFCYRDGWRAGTWEGIEGCFADTPPWYFRTLSSWVRLFIDNGFALTALQEPLHPDTGKPASLILCGQLKSDTGVSP